LGQPAPRLPIAHPGKWAQELDGDVPRIRQARLWDARDNRDDTNVEDAREFSKSAAGTNPVEGRRAQERIQQQAAAETFRAVSALFAEHYAKQNTKESTWRELQRHLDVDVNPRWASGRFAPSFVAMSRTSWPSVISNDLAAHRIQLPTDVRVSSG
jgi:hypothetical protein